MDAPNPWQNGGPKCLSTLNFLSFSWTTSRGFSWTSSRGDLTWCRNMAALTIWFPAKWMPPCRIVWRRNMEALTIWFPAKWMPQIPGEKNAPNACPTMNVLSFSWSTIRGFSWTTSKCDLVWHRNVATLAILFLAKWTPLCGIAWCRNMVTLEIWFPAKWIPKILNEMDAPNVCPTLNVLSISWTTSRGFS